MSTRESLQRDAYMELVTEAESKMPCQNCGEPKDAHEGLGIMYVPDEMNEAMLCPATAEAFDAGTLTARAAVQPQNCFR